MEYSTYQDGVDNNRNYDFAWELDNTPGGLTPESLMYKGPYPFSESESRALRDLGQKYKPIIALDYHSPTYGPSEIVYYCWNWSQHGGNSPDTPTMREIGSHYAGSILKDDNVHSYALGAGVVNKGDFKTYFYGNFGTAAFTIEVSDTTIQDTSLVDSICGRNLAGIYYLLGRSGHARLSGVVTDSITWAPLVAAVEVLEATGDEINPRYTREGSGRYDRLMNPGVYTLRITKDGYAARTIDSVIVSNEFVTISNVQLTPELAAPVLLSPADRFAFCQDSIALNFNWRECANADGYFIEIAVDSLFENPVESDTVFSSTIYRNAAAFEIGRYFWRVTSFNQYSNPKLCERPWSFVLNQAPSPPMVLLPPNNFSIDTLSLLCWQTGADP